MQLLQSALNYHTLKKKDETHSSKRIRSCVCVAGANAAQKLISKFHRIISTSSSDEVSSLCVACSSKFQIASRLLSLTSLLRLLGEPPLLLLLLLLGGVAAPQHEWRGMRYLPTVQYAPVK